MNQLDEKKNLSVEYVTTHLKSKKCFWDHHDLDDVKIFCPIKYVPYQVEMQKNLFIYKGNINKYQNKNLKKIDKNKDAKKIIYDGYYECINVFCSYNCCLSFIKEEIKKKNCLYDDSEILLNKIFLENNKNADLDVFNKIVPAPHWTMLVDYGGPLNIKEFRNFDKQLCKYSNFSHLLTSYKPI